MELSATTEQKIKDIVRLFAESISNLQECGNLVAGLLRDGVTVPALATKTQLGPDVITGLYRVGTKQLLPTLLTAAYPAAKVLSLMPLAEQERAFKEGVEVVIGAGDDHLVVQPQDLTPQQVKRALSKDGLRSRAAQKAVLVEQRSARRPKDPRPWEVTGNKVLVYGACELTKAQVTEMYEKLNGR